MKAVVERIKAEARFFGNTVKEAFLHPLSTSYIDTKTGKVRTFTLDELERIRNLFDSPPITPSKSSKTNEAANVEEGAPEYPGTKWSTNLESEDAEDGRSKD